MSENEPFDAELEVAQLKGDAAVMDLLNRRVAEANAKIADLNARIAKGEAVEAEKAAYVARVQDAHERLAAAASAGKADQEAVDTIAQHIHAQRGWSVPTPERNHQAQADAILDEYMKAAGLDKLPGGRRK